jgi:uncharacterized protein YggE
VDPEAVGAGGKAKKDKKEPEKRVITTSGTASVRVKPDSARVYFRVETYAPTVPAARLDNGEKTRKLLAAVKSLKIANLKMKSDDVNVTLVMQSDRPRVGELPKVLGYHVSSSFTVLVENEDATKLAELAAKVLDSALENGATGVDRVLFFKREMESIRRRALTQAVEDALANARAMATGAQEKVIESIAISNEPRYAYGNVNPGVQNTIWIGQVNEGATPLVAGDLEVTCNVSVTCRY